jgi:hypothetical protein
MAFINLIKPWSPQKVFYADAAGAALTTAILTLILAPLSHLLSIPRHSLFFLAGMAALLFLYSLSTALIKPPGWPIFMKIIALANFIYCPLTWFILIREEASLFAYVYFSGETLLIAAIARTEWIYSNQFISRKFDAY